MKTEDTAVGHELHLMHWNLNSADRHALFQPPPGDIRELIRSSDDLPPLPDIARRLLRFRDDPNASAIGLARIIELDPLLSSQMLRWANSAYYGLREPSESVRDAIVRALGFHAALSLALALTALSPLQTPNQGPIGRDRVWRHGIKSGRLMQELAKALPEPLSRSAGFIQLAGLTQNIGYLLLGHLLPEQFHFLSRLIGSNGSLTLPAIDRFALGIEHTQLGNWLFDVWEMPAALRAVARHHHNPEYAGEHERLVLLTCLADSLLTQTPWGLVAQPTEPETQALLLARLGIAPSVCQAALERILDSAEPDKA